MDDLGHHVVGRIGSPTASGREVETVVLSDQTVNGEQGGRVGATWMFFSLEPMEPMPVVRTELSSASLTLMEDFASKLSRPMGLFT